MQQLAESILQYNKVKMGGHLTGKSFIYSFTRMCSFMMDYSKAPCLTHNLGEECLPKHRLYIRSIASNHCVHSNTATKQHATPTNQLCVTKHTHADLTSTAPQRLTHDTERKSHAKHSRVSNAITDSGARRLWVLCVREEASCIIIASTEQQHELFNNTRKYRSILHNT